MPSWAPDFGAGRASRPGKIEGDWYASNNAAAFQQIIDVTYGLLSPRLLGDELLVHGFVADMVAGVGALHPTDLAQDPRPWPPSFQKGIVQPGPVEMEDRLEGVLRSMINGYDPSSARRPGQTFMASKDPNVCWVLVAGCMIGGSRGGLNHLEALNSFLIIHFLNYTFSPNRRP
jgi:hypothetical protein